MTPRKVTKKDVISEINRLAEQRGETPRMNDMRDFGNYSPKTVRELFGSWNEAIEAAGYEPNHVIGKHTDGGEPTEQELIEDIQRMADKLDRRPTTGDVTEHSEYYTQLFINVFGSWNEAVEAAGFEPHHPKSYGEDELIEHLQRLGDELDRPPKTEDVDEADGPSSSTYANRFGAWGEALQEAGFEHTNRQQYTDGELIQHIKDVADELGRIPRRKDIDEMGGPSSATYRYRFESWTNALIVAELQKPNEEVEGTEDAAVEDKDPEFTDDELLAELNRLTDELDRVPRSIDMIAYGEFNATTYKKRFGSWDDAVEAAGS